VARPAVNGFVFACEFEARSEVVESFFIESHHVEVSAVVVAVAVGTLFRTGLLRSMKTPVPVNEILNVLMAGETLVVGNLGANIVALRAVEHALKGCVTSGKFTGRNLTPQEAGPEQNCQD
jgi:uncharacterized protein YwlG (UPF0340 family)